MYYSVCVFVFVFVLVSSCSLLVFLDFTFDRIRIFESGTPSVRLYTYIELDSLYTDYTTVHRRLWSLKLHCRVGGSEPDRLDRITGY